jgi:hypothetical protein
MEGNNMKAKAMGKATLTLGLMIIVALFLTSCSGGGLVTPELQLGLDEEINKIEEIDYVYLNVPYEKYAGTNWCLPASGAMTFRYFGENITQQQIANVVIKNDKSSVYKMIKYAKDFGFEAKFSYMTIEDIKNSLKKDVPVIAIQNYSLNIPYCHARVVIGYDDEKQEIITNDPTAGKDYKISFSTFTALNTGNNPDLCQVIIISPEEIDSKNAVVINNTNNS